MKSTYEELETTLSETRATLADTQATLADTQATLADTQNLLKLAVTRIAALEEQLNKNSKNSSKPPSTDQKANSTKSDKKRNCRGKGFNRAIIPPEKVNHFVSCSLEKCPSCGSDQLSDLDAALMLQQAELPEVRAIVTQYNCMKHKCKSCEETSIAPLPKGVPDSAFGPRLMALVATLTGVLHQSKRDAIWLVKNLYGIEISEGSIINVEERVGLALNEVYERIHRHVMQSVFCKHFDETSWRNCGKTHYVWLASTSISTCLHIDPNRSKEAFQRFAGILGNAPVVTDRYKAYTHIKKPHQYCLAHLIRDFQKYAERDGPDGEIGYAIAQELRQICRNHREFREGQISKQSRNARFRYQKNRLQHHLLDGYANGSDKLSGLCERLLDCFSKLWTFSKFTDVDPTNNLAERDLRRVVLWRKKSYGTRSDRGKRFVERISSVTQTLKKTGLNILTYLQDTVSDFYHGKTPQLINPAHGF